jgi:tetratricopeptide (TPR) repeat protein
VAAVLPLLRRIAAATQGSEQELSCAGLLASALYMAGQWREAEAMLRDIVPRAETQGQFRTASARTSDLLILLRATGRFEEALGLIDTLEDYTRRAGLGPWTQLQDEGMRLQLLNDLGRYEEVLSAVQGLRTQMQGLPTSSEQDEAVESWNVREVILDAGGQAALRLERWDEALALNAELLDLTKARGAPALEVARTRFNAYGPLLELRRYGEARTLLLECRDTFEAEGDAVELSAVYSALAGLEDGFGHGEPAIIHEQTALRYRYLVGDPGACAISHFNLANYLMRRDTASAAALAQRLACAVIQFQTADGRLPQTLQALSLHRSTFAPATPPLPRNFDEVCAAVEQVEGVRFRDLFSRLPTTRAATGDEALQKVLGQIGTDTTSRTEAE